VSEELITYYQKSDIRPGYRTDHSLINLSLDLSPIKYGKGFWKFNNSLLKDIEFSARIKEHINEIKTQYAISPYDLNNINQIPSSDLQLTINDQLFLGVLMMEIRGETIKYASEKNKRKRGRENLLQKDIQNLEEEFSRSNNRDVLENIETKKTEVEEIRKEKMEGVMLRSKARWIEYGEKPTKYFINLEKRNRVNKTIVHLQNSNDADIRSHEQIMDEIFNFYSKLYDCNDNNLNLEEFDHHLSNSDFPPLAQEQLDKLKGILTRQEVLTVLKKMPNNKSPGSDGFTVEFWKFFFCDLGDFLVRSLNYAYESDELSVTQRLGLITLLPKGNKPKIGAQLLC
jgi:hypothetical protein